MRDPWFGVIGSPSRSNRESLTLRSPPVINLDAVLLPSTFLGSRSPFTGCFCFWLVWLLQGSGTLSLVMSMSVSVLYAAVLYWMHGCRTLQLAESIHVRCRTEQVWTVVKNKSLYLSRGKDLEEDENESVVTDIESAGLAVIFFGTTLK